MFAKPEAADHATPPWGSSAIGRDAVPPIAAPSSMKAAAKHKMKRGASLPVSLKPRFGRVRLDAVDMLGESKFEGGGCFCNRV